MTREEKIARVEKIQKVQAILDAQEGGAKEVDNSFTENALRGLDYARATTGGPLVAKALGVDDPEETAQAREFKGDYPSTADLLRRYLEKNASPWAPAFGLSNPVVQAGVGFVGDVLTDPMTYASSGVSALARAGKGGRAVGVANALLNPLEAYSLKRKDQLYKAAFKDLDSLAAEKAKTLAPSKILEEADFVGNYADATKKLKDVNVEAGAEIGSVLKQAADKGAKVDTYEIFSDALNKAQELRLQATPEAKKLAEDITSRVGNFIESYGDDIPVDVANREKSFLNQLIKESGYNVGPEASLGIKGKKQIARGIQQGVPGAVEKVDPELVKRLKPAMERYSSTSPSIVKKATQKARGEEKVAENIMGINPRDLSFLLGAGGGLLGLSQYANNNPSGYATTILGSILLGKTGQQLFSPKGRTLRGAAAKAIGEAAPSLLLDPAARRSTWSLLNEEEK